MKSIFKKYSQKLLSHEYVSNTESAIIKCIGCLGPALIPPLHIVTLYYFWHKFSRHVDKRHCSCSCWDTVFKGSYESGIASYKHMYFNATFNSLKIWVLTVVCIIAFYEAIRWLTVLFIQRHLRYSMFVLFLSAIFSHYYSWWSYFNYWNDDYYSQWYHQLFFSTTEVISTVLVVHLADSRNAVTPMKALAVVAIAVVHVLAGSWDQFFMNVLRGEGDSHQVVRDINFMIPDVCHVVIPILELKKSRRNALPHPFHTSSDLRKEYCFLATIIISGLIICSFI